MFEQKYGMGTQDGKDLILWDINKIIAGIAHANIPVKYLNVNELCDIYLFNGDAKYAMTTDINKPCIIVDFAGKGQKLIDGNHRLYKAKMINQETIPCYILPDEYHMKFIVNFDIEQYNKVISEYYA